MQDLVAKYPKEISSYLRINGKLPQGIYFEDHFICVWNKKFYIHTRAVLPLRAFDSGVGFGLWVEVTKEDFKKYVEIKDEDYLSFKTEGKLADDWPGFENMFGVKVVVNAVRDDEKVYITEVLEANDPLFQAALLTKTDDKDGIYKIYKLVEAYAADPDYNQPIDW